LPAHLLRDNQKTSAALAKGDRMRADDLAGELLNASPSAVEKARGESIGPGGELRLSKTGPMKQDAWEELIALVRLSFGT